MKHLLYALLVAGLMVGTAQAGTILLVSDSEVPGGSGTDHHDDNLVAFLQDLGHTVDTSGMNEQMREGGTSPWAAGNEAKLANLQNADLVVVSRRTGSGGYDDDRKGWNELTTPLLLMSGYLTRGETAQKKWGWTTGGSGDAAKAETDMDIDETGHAFVAGVSDPTTLFDWSTVPAGDDKAPKGVYLPNAGDDHAGTLIGTFDGRPMLMDIAAGTNLDTLNSTTDKYGTTGERRAFFADWGYDMDLGDPFDRQAQFDDFITDDYKTVLGNMVGTMIPEPATLALLGLGLGAMLVRRRK